MIENRTKIIEKALKLQELANRGIDGEKDNASRMLDAYKKKHKITEQELKSTSLNDSEFLNMTPEEFLKHMDFDLKILGFGLLIYALGRFSENKKVSDMGYKVIRQSVKKKDNSSNEPIKPRFSKSK